MVGSDLFRADYKPQFSGHETFPLRYGWLKKAYDAVAKAKPSTRTNPFLADDAIASFGVGRNMVASIRYWAMAAEVIQERSRECSPAWFGDLVFGEKGVDPFMEAPGTGWAVHWNLCADPKRTTWFWVFGHFSQPGFERQALVGGLERLAADQEWSRASKSTIKRDVECFLRSYVAKPIGGGYADETVESPLAELGLIRPIGKRDGFRFVRGAHRTLPRGVFAFAVLDFWRRRGDGASTLSFEALAFEPGSPGRVFMLDQTELTKRLETLAQATDGAIEWTETAGLKQLVRNKNTPTRLRLDVLRSGLLSESWEDA